MVGRLAEIAYAEMEPVAKPYDEAAGWPLLHYLHAFFMPMQKIDDLVRDKDDGPGWSILFDPDRVPARYLPFTAMVAGVVLRPEMSEQEKRDRIKERDGIKRCTPDAFVRAIQQQLTGDKGVVLRLRFDPAAPAVDSPGHFQVLTYLDETPNADAVIAAMQEQKIVGLVQHYEIVAGQDWQELVDTYGTWQAVVDDYATWAHVLADDPTP